MDDPLSAYLESHIKAPVAGRLYRLGLRANALTVAGFATCVLAAVLLVTTGLTWFGVSFKNNFNKI